LLDASDLPLTGIITVLDRSAGGCRTVLNVAQSAEEAVSQILPEVGAGQAVDEEVDAVVAEEDGARDVHPAARPVRRRQVLR